MSQIFIGSFPPELRQILGFVTGADNTFVSSKNVLNLGPKVLKDGKWEYSTIKFWSDQLD